MKFISKYKYDEHAFQSAVYKLSVIIFQPQHKKQ